jgi:hypothetical protein
MLQPASRPRKRTDADQLRDRPFTSSHAPMALDYQSDELALLLT